MDEMPVIGIDLGTSTSEIAYLKDGRPELLQDEYGDRIIPSVVQFPPDGQVIVGTVAKSGAIAYADRTIGEVKRRMGTDETMTAGDRTFRPEEVSAIILRHLKTSAEAKLGAGTVREAVISVPARFDNPAREATRRAAELSGLRVLRLINEPTAAALSYGLDRLQDEQKVLVFDFGGGTLDVTVLEMFEGVLDVRTSVGDERLGGSDVDTALIQFFERTFEAEHGVVLDKNNLQVRARLKEEAERYKKLLSTATIAQIDIPFLSPQGGITGVTMTRTGFESLIADLVNRAMALVEEALKRAKLTFAEIDVVLPVGGSSRIPAFRRELEKRWGKPLQEYDNPDEAVARGAAIAAGLEQVAKSDEAAIAFQDIANLVLLDVSPHRLGISVVEEVGARQYIDDFFSEMIPKDEKLPAIRSNTFATLYDGQDKVILRIYQDEHRNSIYCKDCLMIAELPLENLPKGSAGQPIKVEFRYTNDGVLEVNAHCVDAPEVQIDAKFKVIGRGDEATLTEQQASLDDLWTNSDAIKRYMPLLDQATRFEGARPGDADKVQAVANALRNALMGGTPEEIERRADELTEILYELS